MEERATGDQYSYYASVEIPHAERSQFFVQLGIYDEEELLLETPDMWIELEQTTTVVNLSMTAQPSPILPDPAWYRLQRGYSGTVTYPLHVTIIPSDDKAYTHEIRLTADGAMTPVTFTTDKKTGVATHQLQIVHSEINMPDTNTYYVGELTVMSTPEGSTQGIYTRKEVLFYADDQALLMRFETPPFNWGTLIAGYSYYPSVELRTRSLVDLGECELTNSLGVEYIGTLVEDVKRFYYAGDPEDTIPKGISEMRFGVTPAMFATNTRLPVVKHKPAYVDDPGIFRCNLEKVPTVDGKYINFTGKAVFDPYELRGKPQNHFTVDLYLKYRDVEDWQRIKTYTNLDALTSLENTEIEYLYYDSNAKGREVCEAKFVAYDAVENIKKWEHVASVEPRKSLITIDPQGSIAFGSRVDASEPGREGPAIFECDYPAIFKQGLFTNGPISLDAGGTSATSAFEALGALFLTGDPDDAQTNTNIFSQDTATKGIHQAVRMGDLLIQIGNEGMINTTTTRLITFNQEYEHIPWAVVSVDSSTTNDTFAIVNAISTTQIQLVYKSTVAAERWVHWCAIGKAKVKKPEEEATG